MYEWWKAELSPNPEDYPKMVSLTIEDIIKEGIPISPMAKKKKKKREGIESLDVFSKLASAKDDFDFYYQILSRYYTPSDLAIFCILRT